MLLEITIVLPFPALYKYGSNIGNCVVGDFKINVELALCVIMLTNDFDKANLPRLLNVTRF